MRDVSEIEQAIVDTRERIELLRADRLKTEAELQALKESNAHLMARSAGREREPSSLKTQREDRLRTETKIEEIESAIELLTGEVHELELEKAGAEGHGDLVTYFASKEAFLSKRKELHGLIENFLSLGKEIERKAEELNRQRNPLNGLRLAVEKCAGFDIEALKAGEIAEPTSNESFVNRELAELLPMGGGFVKLTPLENLLNHVVSSDPLTVASWRRELMQFVSKPGSGRERGGLQSKTMKAGRPFSGPEDVRHKGPTIPPGNWPHERPATFGVSD